MRFPTTTLCSLLIFFVYIDLDTQEYVISYPEDPSTAGGRRITVRFEPGHLVEPEITVAIQQDSGKFIYTYTVRNGEKARRPLRWFHIVAASNDDSAAPSHPRWGASVGSPSVAPQGGLIDAPARRLSADMGKFVSWVNSAQPIMPGQTVAGFRLTSTFRPGITTS